MKEAKKITVRECIYIISIISLVQGIVWYISFENANNLSALSYVSFAETLISIILAILAIGYTYGESIAQKSQGESLTIQLCKLNDIIKNLEVEAVQLESISGINQELLALSENLSKGMEDTHKKVDDVKIEMNKLITVSDRYLFSDYNSPNLDKKLLCKLYFNHVTLISELSAYTIFFLDGKNVDGVSDLIESYIDDTHKDLGYNMTSDNNKKFLQWISGSTITMLHSLNGLSLLKYDNDSIKLSEELKELITVLPSNGNNKLSGDLGVIRSKFINNLFERKSN